MSIKLSTKYILSAIKADRSRVFYAIDSHSGGYGYWASYPGAAKEFDSAIKIDQLSTDDYLRKEVIKIEVLRVETMADIVSTEEIVSEAKAQAMAEIAVIEKQLQEKTKALRSMS